MGGTNHAPITPWVAPITPDSENWLENLLVSASMNGKLGLKIR